MEFVFIFGGGKSVHVMLHLSRTDGIIWEAECTIFKLLGMYCVTAVLFSAI